MPHVSLSFLFMPISCFYFFLLNYLQQGLIFVFPSDIYWVYQRRDLFQHRDDNMSEMTFCNTEEIIFIFPNIGSK